MIRKILKPTLFIVLLALITFGVVYWKRNAIVNAYAPTLQESLSTVVGRPVQLGNLTLELWPLPHLLATAVQIGAAEGARESVTVERVSVALKILPLLVGKIQLDSIVLERPKFRVLDDGGNGKRSTVTFTDDSHQKGPKVEKSRNRGESLIAGSLEVIDGSFFDDTAQLAKQAWFTRALMGINFRTTVHQDGPVIRFGRIEGQCRAGDLGTIEFSSPRLVVDMENHRSTFDLATVSLLRSKVEFRDLDYNYASDAITISLGSRELAIEQWNPFLGRILPSADQYHLRGVIAPQLKVAVSPRGKLALSGTIPFSQFGFSMEGTRVSGGTGTFEIQGDAESQEVKLQNARLEIAGGGVVIANGAVRFPSARGSLELTSEGISLPILLKALNFPFSTPALEVRGGNVSPDVRVLFNGEWPPAIEGSLGLSGVEGEIRGVALSKGEVPLGIISKEGISVAQGEDLRVLLGSGKPIPLTGSLRISSGKEDSLIELSGPEVPIEDFVLAIRPLLPATWRGAVAGMITPSASFAFGPQSPFSVHAEGNVREIKLEGFAAPLTDGAGALRLDYSSGRFLLESPEFAAKLRGEGLRGGLQIKSSTEGFNLKLSSVRAAGGEITVELTRDGRTVSATGLGRGLDIGRLGILFDLNLDAAVQGKISRLDFEFSGDDVPNLTASRVSSGRAEGVVREVYLRGINLARVVVEQLNSLPFIGGNIMRRFPEEYAHIIDAQGTRFDEISGSIKITRGLLSSRDIVVLGDFYALTARGEVDLRSGTIDATTLLTFDRPFSLALAKNTKALQRILSSSGQIEIPVRITGSLRDPQVLPDFKRLLELGARRALEQEAGKLLEKALRR